MKPLIGITGREIALGLVATSAQKFAQQRVNTYFAAFADAVAQAGGIPVYLPFAGDPADVVGRIDALVITGGQDVHPQRWGGAVQVADDIDPRWSYDVHDAQRDVYEAGLLGAALAINTPVLGICRGHQLLNVVLGGTLIEDLPEGPIQHVGEYSAPCDGEPDHVISFDEGSIAHGVYGATIATNSWHHQAIDRPGDGLSVVGRTDDCVVECVEIPGRPVLGVQWHPEWMASQPDPIFSWLVQAANASARAAAQSPSYSA